MTPAEPKASHSSDGAILAGSEPPRADEMPLSLCFETILSTITDFTYLIDLDGRFRFVNKPLLDLWGRTLEQAIGKNFFDLNYPSDLAAKLQRQIQQVIKTGKRLVDEAGYTSPTGIAGYYEYIFSPVFAADGSVAAVAGSTRVITTRKQLEMDRERLLAALENQRSRLAAVVEQAPAFICTLRGPLHIFELVNARYYDLVGKRSIVGKTVREAFPEVEGQGFFELLDQVFGTGEPFIGNEMPIELRRPDGSRDLRHMNFVYQALHEADGNISGIFVHGIDVTDMVRSRQALLEREQSLRTSEERLAFSVDAAELGTFYCPMPLGEIIWNDKCKEHFWLASDALINFDVFYSILHPDDREPTRRAVEQAVFRRSSYDVQYRTLSPDGKMRWIQAKGRAYYNEAGDPVRFDGVTLDITGRKRVEEERQALLESEQAAREQADRASRMKDDFLATLSHELRTPLNAIVGWATILTTGTPDEADLRDGLATIQRNARAQTQIIEDLLDMSRIISGKVRLQVQATDLVPIVRAAIETVKPAADAKGVQIHAVLDSLAGSVSGDSNRLQQVFWNLLNNAVKFTPRGGQVQVVLEKAKSHVEVTVADTGEGIRPEFLPHVFDRFRQADASTTRQHGGLGLGLAIVRQLVELHGGTVRVHSAGTGQGSTFIVALPATDVQSIAQDADAEPVAEPSPGIKIYDPILCPQLNSVQVLVVDDEADARSLVKRLLEDCQAVVRTAGSVEEAMRQIIEHPPHVLISDIGMPGEDGYSLIRRVRALVPEQGGRIPAVALTAYARSEDRLRALRAGYQTHVAKPIEPIELITVVASLVGQTARDS